MKSVYCRVILSLLLISNLLGGYFVQVCKASEARKIPYSTYVFLGAPKTGKSSFANLLLNHLKEQSEGVGIQTSIVPAWQYDRPSGKSLTSEIIQTNSFFRVTLGKHPTSDIEFSATRTDSFNAYVYPQGVATILDTQGLEFEHINESAKTLKQSLNTLDASIGVRFAQGVIFISVPTEDTRSICLGEQDDLSEKFKQQITGLRRLIKKLPTRFADHFSIILTPDYDDIPQSDTLNALKGLQAVASGASPYRAKFSKFLSDNLNIKLRAKQIFAIDSGDALVDLLNHGENLQSQTNAKILTEALEHLNGAKIGSIMWAQDKSERSSNKTYEALNTQKLHSDLERLFKKSGEIEFLSRQTKSALNQFKHYTNSLSNTLEESKGITIHRRPAVVELKKLSTNTSAQSVLEVHSSFRDEISMTGFTVDSYQFGLDENGEFVVKKARGGNNKFEITDVANLPNPKIKQKINSRESDMDLNYELKFTYESYPDILLEFKQSDFLEDVDLFASLLVDGAVSFHNRGNLSKLLSRGTPVHLPIISDSISFQGSEEISLEAWDSHELSNKRAILRQCSQMRDCSKLLSRECKSCIDGLEPQVAELAENTANMIEKISKQGGSEVCSEACYHLCYFDKTANAPLSCEYENASFNSLQVGYKSAESAFAGLETKLERERSKFSRELGYDVLSSNCNEYESLLASLSDSMRDSLINLKDAFERKEIVSYQQDGGLRYSSTVPEHLLAVYNLSLIPNYFVPRTDEEKVSKYLNPENEAHYQSIFSISDAREDLANRIEPQRKINILFFGPKESGKSTLANFLNHFASTIDANRMEEILKQDHIFAGPKTGFASLWGQESLKETLAGTWVQHYYPKPLQKSQLRAIIPSRIPHLDDEAYTQNFILDRTVPTYMIPEKFQNSISENQVREGTQEEGNLIDSMMTQAPYIEPLYRLTTLDASGFSVPRPGNPIRSGIKNSRVLDALEKFKNAGHESIDALGLVIDGAKFMRLNLGDLRPEGNLSYLKKLKGEIEQITEIQKELNLPLHVVFTHAREIFPYHASTGQTQASLAKMRSLLEAVLSQSHLSPKVHAYAMDFSKLWSLNSSRREWNQDFRRCLYESGRLLERIFEDQSQGISVPLEQFEESLRKRAQARVSNIRLEFRGGFTDAGNLRLESSSNHHFNEDIEPVMIEGQTLAGKVRDLVAADMNRVHEPEMHRNRGLPYLVGVVIKGRHPNVTAEKVEIFPLHHVYKLNNPTADYPWINSDYEVRDLNATKYLSRLDELKRSLALHQAGRVVAFIEDIDLDENDTKVLFTQIGSSEDIFKTSYKMSGYVRGVYQDEYLHQTEGSLLNTINELLRSGDLPLTFRDSLNPTIVNSVSQIGGGNVSLRQVRDLQDINWD